MSTLVVFYHYDDRPMVQSELPGRQPSKRIVSFFWKSGIETGLESLVFTKQQNDYSHNESYSFFHYLRCEGQRCDTYPWRNRPIIGAIRCPACDIIIEGSLHSLHGIRGWPWPIACGKSPYIFAIAPEAHRIFKGILIMNMHGPAAILKIIYTIF